MKRLALNLDTQQSHQLFGALDPSPQRL